MLYQDPDRVSFHFLEYDNNTTTNLERIQRKLAGYLAYRAHNRLAKLLTHYKDKYLLPLSSKNIAQLDFRVLTVTTDPDRRNHLAEQACKLPNPDRFYFASMTDLTPETILTPTWLSAGHYRSLYDEQKQLPKSVKRSVRNRWITEQVDTLPRVAFTTHK